MAKNQLFADVYARLGMSISALQYNVFKCKTVVLIITLTLTSTLRHQSGLQQMTVLNIFSVFFRENRT